MADKAWRIPVNTDGMEEEEEAYPGQSLFESCCRCKMPLAVLVSSNTQERALLCSQCEEDINTDEEEEFETTYNTRPIGIKMVVCPACCWGHYVEQWHPVLPSGEIRSNFCSSCIEDRILGREYTRQPPPDPSIDEEEEEEEVPPPTDQHASAKDRHQE